MQVIRENQVVVVVGETGSGKTTQLTQVCSLLKLSVGLSNFVLSDSLSVACRHSHMCIVCVHFLIFCVL